LVRIEEHRGHFRAMSFVQKNVKTSTYFLVVFLLQN